MCLLFAGCSREPSYPPPPQRQPILTEERPGGSIVAMSDPSAETYIVRDISDTVEGGSWRWTYEHPELRFWLDSAVDRKLSVDFLCSGITLANTGPIAISFSVNEHALGEARCAKEGQYRFEKNVPPEWLDTTGSNAVGAQANKLWTAPADGKKLGFILLKAGFE